MSQTSNPEHSLMFSHLRKCLLSHSSASHPSFLPPSFSWLLSTDAHRSCNECSARPEVSHGEHTISFLACGHRLQSSQLCPESGTPEPSKALQYGDSCWTRKAQTRFGIMFLTLNSKCIYQRLKEERQVLKKVKKN